MGAATCRLPARRSCRRPSSIWVSPICGRGAGPTNGFDCSGLCMYVYKQFGVSLPHYSRSMATYGTAVSKDDLEPGDLVFFYTPISHVGMYVGGGMMINAPRSGDLVCIEDAFRTSYVTARRMISPYTRYEQADSRLAYTGAWSKSTTSSASGGDFAYSDTAGSSVTVSFNGTYLGLVTKKSSVYGIAKITLDGGTPKTVDLYSATTVYQQKVWNTGTLADGDHTVTIEWSGTKNGASTATNIGIDALDLKGSLKQATSTVTPPAGPTTALFEQTDAHLAFTGTWSASTSSSASGGAFTYVDMEGASATIAFDGTSLAWLAKTSNAYGIAKVTLDDKTCVLVDLYSASTLYRQKVWQTGTLPAGRHTVTIEWTGSKNPASGATNIGLDAVELAGEIAQAPAVTPAPATTRYDHTDSHIAYTGTWATFSTGGASGGSYARANANGTSVTISFTGRYLAWIATRGTTLSGAKISLDGGAATTIDLAASVVAYQQKVWDTGTLTDGAHTVTITRDSANAAGKYFSLDAVDVAGTLTTAAAAPTTPTTPVETIPATTSYEQKDTRFTFSGGWIASSSNLASGTSFRFANSTAYATAAFNGTYLVWIGKKSPDYGQAKVSVDSGAPVIVDLYNSSAIWQQKLWNTGVLPAGDHTVRIEWTGVKNANGHRAPTSTSTLSRSPAPSTRRMRPLRSGTNRATAASSTRARGRTPGPRRPPAGTSASATPGGSSLTVTFTGSVSGLDRQEEPGVRQGEGDVGRRDPGHRRPLQRRHGLWPEVWETGALVPGTHTIKIEWTGTRSSAATGTNIGVDAFDIIGNLK